MNRLLTKALKPVPRTRSSFSSALNIPATSPRPEFFNSVKITNSDGVTYCSIPVFRLLDSEGTRLSTVDKEWSDQLDAVSPGVLLKLYRTMLMLPALDTILSSSQRQGRISFYMSSYGEEGAVVGSAAAWENTDEVFAQYREVGVLLYRDYPLSSLMAQVFGSAKDDSSLGRQMPCHFGSATHHFHTISSPLATQIPQAAGAAYALKKSSGRCVVCYMGEGAASEGDFHAGMNMASVLGGPCVFFVRNNGFAISTPSSEQYRGDGIASRGPAYGMDTVRVDGNDPVAVLLACKEARRRAVDGQKPVLVEAITYRVGHHSTSDDSSAYRSASAVENVKKFDSPLLRLRRHLESRSIPLWSSELEDSTRAQHKKEILLAFSQAEKEKKPALDLMWHDTFHDMERPQREQRQELRRLVTKWGAVWKDDLDKLQGGSEAFLAVDTGEKA